MAIYHVSCSASARAELLGKLPDAPGSAAPSRLPSERAGVEQESGAARRNERRHGEPVERRSSGVLLVAARAVAEENPRRNAGGCERDAQRNVGNQVVAPHGIVVGVTVRRAIR